MKRSLGEMLGLSSQSAHHVQSSEHKLWHIPLNQLTTDETLALVKKTGSEYLLPIAFYHMDNDLGNFELLIAVLKTLVYPWEENTTEVQHIRILIDRALSELNEWDGNSIVQVEAMHCRIAILEAWAKWEQSLSRIPVQIPYSSITGESAPPNSMDKKKEKSDKIILYLLYISLLNIRSIAHGGKRAKERLIESIEMIHGTPSLLHGNEFNEKAVQWFLDVQGDRFIRDYPLKEDGTYLQVISVLKELRNLLESKQIEENIPSHPNQTMDQLS